MRVKTVENKIAGLNGLRSEQAKLYNGVHYSNIALYISSETLNLFHTCIAFFTWNGNVTVGTCNNNISMHTKHLVSSAAYMYLFLVKQSERC